MCGLRHSGRCHSHHVCVMSSTGWFWHVSAICVSCVCYIWRRTVLTFRTMPFAPLLCFFFLMTLYYIGIYFYFFNKKKDGMHVSIKVFLTSTSKVIYVSIQVFLTCTSKVCHITPICQPIPGAWRQRGVSPDAAALHSGYLCAKDIVLDIFPSPPFPPVLFFWYQAGRP